MIYRQFSVRPEIESMPDPAPTNDGVVLRVMASGICLSDWHGWQGHDADIELPHVPGHELAGIVEAVGKDVSNWRAGQRVTVPFVCGCGSCPQCDAGNQQVCDRQFQPGFTGWGSFSEYVAIRYADGNLVSLPEAIDFPTAASLGCRFATSFRAIVDQGHVAANQQVVVHGCGGVGLSAIMIANALGAKVVAVDLDDEKLLLAREVGAHATVNANSTPHTVEAIRDLTDGGAHVSIDAIGDADVCFRSIASLRKSGKHIQIGLMVGNNSEPTIPMAQVLANELQVIGSHGMQAHRYSEMLEMIASGVLLPQKLLGRKVNLEQSIDVLTSMDQFNSRGVTVITEF